MEATGDSLVCCCCAFLSIHTWNTFPLTDQVSLLIQLIFRLGGLLQPVQSPTRDINATGLVLVAVIFRLMGRVSGEGLTRY